MMLSRRDLDAAVRQLADAESVAFGGVGIAGTLLPVTEAYRSIEAALPDQAGEIRDRLAAVLSGGSPAGRVYAATLLARIDPGAARAAWEAMRDDRAELRTFSGCFLDLTTLGEYAEHRLDASP